MAEKPENTISDRQILIQMCIFSGDYLLLCIDDKVLTCGKKEECLVELAHRVALCKRAGAVIITLGGDLEYP